MKSTRRGSKPTIGIFGLSHWGRHIAKTCIRLGIPIVGVEPHEPTRKSASRLFPSVQLSSDPDAILMRPDVQAIIITAPSSIHYRLAKQALIAHKHVLVEKPMTQNPKEAAELVTLASRQNRILMVDHTYMFSPAVIRAKKIIGDNRLGTINRIVMTRTGPGPVRPDSSVLWDLLPHDISTGAFLLDAFPVRARIIAPSVHSRHPAYEATVEFVFPHHVIGQSSISWIMPQKERRISIIGTKAALTIDWTGTRETLILHPVTTESGVRMFYGAPVNIATSTTEPLAGMLGHFLTCITRKIPPMSDGKFGAQVVRLISRLENNRP